MKARKDWKGRFLKSFAQSGNVTLAARAAGVHRTLCYLARESSVEFSKQWDDAQEQAADLMEAEALRRGRNGTLKPVFHQGIQCGVIREYSDSLLMFLLKAARPQKYRDNYSVAVGNIDGTKLEIDSRQQAVNLFATSPEAADHMIALANLMIPKEAMPPDERGPTQPTRGAPESSPEVVSMSDQSGGSPARGSFAPGPDDLQNTPSPAQGAPVANDQAPEAPKMPKRPAKPAKVDWRQFIPKRPE